ncbi:hypothetical protein QZM28_14530 [Burkholderia multivorans]|nr:hypothetical protein [Burkholderia multivorans]
MSETVFWSWQSDLPAATTKDFIKDALAQALEQVSEELQLEMADRLELDHDTKGEPGLVEIVSTIFRKIEDCQIFVADITPIAEIKTDTVTKKIPNPNVMLELGYAIREAGPQRVITVANLAFGGKPEELPFDLRHRRGAITYRLDSEKDPAIEKVRKGLVKQLAAALTTNLRARREDQLIRNPMPALSVSATEDSSKVLVVQQEVHLNDVPSLAEVMAKTPLRTKAQQRDPESPFELLRSQSFGMFPGGRVKPFSAWTEEELDGYNKRVQWYYDSYETYLEQLKEYRLLRQRAVSIQLAVANLGTRPATDVWAKITFPDGVLVYEDDDLPKPPDKPAPPPLAPHGFVSSTILQPSQFDASFLSTRPRIDDEHKSIVFQTDKIQHGFQKPFKSFTIVMSTQADIRSFEVSYQVGSDELPRQTTGNLYFEVRQAE